MAALGRYRDEYFVWAILLVVIHLLIGSCPVGVESSTVNHGHGGEQLEFVSHGDDISQHDSSHSQCQGNHHHHHHHDDHNHNHNHHHHEHAHDHGHFPTSQKSRLPEELEEEEDLRLYGFGSPYADHEDDAHDEDHLSTTGLWVHAMGSSLLVSMASLICLMIIPLIVLQGKPSKTVVDSLAAFGVGAMLGDAFLHQLPHALGGSGKHSHSHSDSLDHGHNHNHIHGHSHAGIGFHAEKHSHSLEELSVGLAALAGIILFFLVEKVVRYVEEHSAQVVHHSHHHHQHHHKSSVPSKKDEGCHEHDNTTIDHRESGESDKAHEVKSLDAIADGHAVEKESQVSTNIRKRRNTSGADKVGNEIANSSDTSSERFGAPTDQSPNPTSNLVLGYLNLFSDGVHNFTDGMALGSAFLLHGSVGGWSRTLFLLAHELPQEIGDFGILVSSGFSVFKALLFNFLSALVALAGTALALLIGEDPGHSSWIEGFTAGGFIYIALAGVLPEMHQKGASFRSTLFQLTALTLGMGVALCISLWE